MDKTHVDYIRQKGTFMSTIKEFRVLKLEIP